MTPITIKHLDEKRFNALAGLSRSPAAAYISEEIGWLANEGETILGVILHDTVDDDFVVVVLAKDEGGRFRAFDQEASIATPEDAFRWAEQAIKWHIGGGVTDYAQGDLSQGPDLFTPVVSTERLHPHFVLLANEPSFLPARSMITRMMPHYIDIDGTSSSNFRRPDTMHGSGSCTFLPIYQKNNCFSTEPT